MAIPTSRTRESGKVSIDYSKCNGCSRCVEVCPDNEYKLIKGKVVPSGTAVFGCIGCGHCIAICHEEAIRIEGRQLSINDLFPLPESLKTNFPDLLTLLQRRRSIREFSNKEIQQETIDQLITAAKTAPMGIPPSDVNLLIIKGRRKNHDFTSAFINLLKSQQWLISKWFLFLMRPFWGKVNDDLFRRFLRPLVRIYISSMNKGKNIVTYDAPLTLYFYGTAYSDPADPVIAATYAMIAAESLGLASCMVGAIHPFLQHGKKADEFRKKFNIRQKSKAGLFLLVGYGKTTYKKGINRTFAHIDYLG